MFLLVYFLVLFGITYSITDTKILKIVRERLRTPLNGLLDCFYCTGYWVYLIGTLMLFNDLTLILLIPFAINIVSWVIYLIITILVNKADL